MGSVAATSVPAKVQQTDAVAQAFARADRRIEQQREGTRVQLSAFGRIQGGFASLESAGQTAADPRRATTNADVRKNVQNLVAAYNGTQRAVSMAVTGEGRRRGDLADDARARIAGNDLRRLATAGDNSGDLRRLGINANPDGTLNLDVRTLERALESDANVVRESVARVGSQMARTASNQLGVSGDVGGAVTALGSRARSLEAQQQDQQARAAAAQQSMAQQGERSRSVPTGGVASYQRIFSL